MASRKRNRNVPEELDRLEAELALGGRSRRAIKLGEAPVVLHSERPAEPPRDRRERIKRENQEAREKYLDWAAFRRLAAKYPTLKDIAPLWPTNRGAKRSPRATLTKIWEYRQANPTHGKRRIASALGVDMQTVRARLEELKRYGFHEPTPTMIRPRQ